MNVSRQAITKWESGEGLPDVSNLQELPKGFNFTVDYLLDNIELPENTTDKKFVYGKNKFKQFKKLS